MDLLPIWLLHALLLPMNCRFWVICLREKLEAKKSPIAAHHAKRRANVLTVTSVQTQHPATPQRSTAPARLVNSNG
jgi:hypothetical protein